MFNYHKDLACESDQVNVVVVETLWRGGVEQVFSTTPQATLAEQSKLDHPFDKIA